MREGSPVLLVVLAVATGTLVLAQHQSWRQSQLDQAAFATGADVRVGLAAPLPLGRRPRRSRRPAACSPRCRSARSTAGSTSCALGAGQGGGHGAAPAGPVQPLPAAVALAPDHPGGTGAGLLLPGQARPAGHQAAMLPPAARGRGHPARMSASLSVQDGSGIVYSVPAGNAARRWP